MLEIHQRMGNDAFLNYLRKRSIVNSAIGLVLSLDEQVRICLRELPAPALTD
jgi:hypothetical protein